MAKKPRWHETNPEFDDYDLTLSKTEQKKAMHRLQALGERLAALPAKKIKQLPADERLIEALLTLKSTTSASAKKRQVNRVGKVFAEHADPQIAQIIEILFEHVFSVPQQAKVMAWVDRLTNSDDQIKPFCKQHPAAEPNTINQQLIWIEHGSRTGDDELVEAAQDSLRCYVQQVAILSR